VSAVPIASMGLVVPAYFHPAVAPTVWQHLVRLASRLRLVIVNVHNGPGADLDPCYPPVIEALREAGVRMAGYVDTDYGRRSPAEITEEVDTWLRRYGVDGVFMDQVSPGLADLDHYAQCVLATRSAGARFVALNPGTHPHPGYADLANLTVTFEGPWSGYRSLPIPGWVTQYPSSRFVHLVHSVPVDVIPVALDLAARRHARGVFLTYSQGANPWDHVPALLTGQMALAELSVSM
jgi:hypothetical protein